MGRRCLRVGSIAFQRLFGLCRWSRAGLDHDSANLAHHRRSRLACAEWVSRGGARARRKPVENNRPHCDEDRIQGDHHRNSACTGPRGRRNSAINNVTLDIASNAVTAIIGPSGCGKSTFIRALNRMHELVPKTRVEGTVLLQGEDLYSSSVDPAVVRRRVGMVFQKSNPFPTMSIGENVVMGLRLNGVRDRKFLNERLERSLRMAALWD